ncbi:CorA family divalent cation transporter [Lysinibacillus agricola]
MVNQHTWHNLLTVISSIMLPLTVITSFFGMDVPIPIFPKCDNDH